MRKDRVRRALTDVFPPTVHVPRCQAPSASSFLSSESLGLGPLRSDPLLLESFSLGLLGQNALLLGLFFGFPFLF